MKLNMQRQWHQQVFHNDQGSQTSHGGICMHICYFPMRKRAFVSVMRLEWKTPSLNKAIL